MERKSSKRSNSWDSNQIYQNLIKSQDSSQVTIAAKVFRKRWNCFFSRSDKSKNKANGGVFHFFEKKDILHVLVASLIMCISAVGIPAQSIVYGIVMKRLSVYLKGEQTDEDFLSRCKIMCGCIILIGGARLFLESMGVFSWMTFGEVQAERARNKVYQVISTSPLQWFEETEDLAGKYSQTNRCIEEFRNGASEYLGLTIQASCAIVLLFVVAMVHSWSLTLVILGGSPIVVLVSCYFGRTTNRWAQEENYYSSLSSNILDWCFFNGSTVRIFNGKYNEIVKFNKLMDGSAKRFYKLSNAISANIGFIRSMCLLAFVQGIWFGSFLVTKDNSAINRVITCFSACLLMLSQVMQLSIMISQFSKANAAVRRIIEFIENIYVLPKFMGTGIYLEKCEGKIEFRNVTFRYPTRPNVILKDFNFCSVPNRINYIIGESGSGKSTICTLLLRLYDFEYGLIKIDGSSILNVSEKWLFDNITVAQQNPVIIEDTFRNNLAFAIRHKYTSLDDVPVDLIRESASFAMLDDLISELPNGLDTDLSHYNLSGGQRQRLEIARARLRDTLLLIFDETFTGLDTRNKNILISRIKRWRRNKSTLIITHDLKYIEPCDYVIQVGQGKVIYQGDFEDFGESSGLSFKENSLDYKDSQSKIVNEKFDVLPDSRCSATGLKEKEEDTENPVKLLSIREVIKFCMHTSKCRLLIILGLLVSLLCGIVSPIFSFFFSKILGLLISVSLGENKKSDLVKWSCVVIGISCIDGLASYVSVFVLSVSSEKWVLFLRKESLRRILNQDMSYFSKSMGPAELTALLINDTRDLRNLISEFVPAVVRFLSIILVGIVWSLIIGWKVALVGIGFVILILLVTHFYSILLRYSENKYKEKVASWEENCHEYMRNIKAMKLWTLEKHFEAKQKKNSIEVQKSGYLRAAFTGIGVGISAFLTPTAIATILYYGMYLITVGEYTYSSFLQTVTIFSFSMTNALIVFICLPRVARAQRAATYLVDLLSLPPSSTETGGFYSGLEVNDQAIISFEKVNFKYMESQPYLVLKNLSFRISQGENVAITGESGSGKSTIANLLLRLFDVSKNSIRFAGRDLNDVDIDWLRENISLVCQYNSFFEGTIYENLTYGVNPRQFVAPKVEYYLKCVNMYSFVSSLPEGMHTYIRGGQNMLFSAGQLQRLAIVRALLRYPKVLILDECTANLDSQNVSILLEFLEKHLFESNMTLIFLTHDSRITNMVDRVIVLEKPPRQ